jgi:NADH:ubiquinone oxidoreductase subunit 6 (subunit J)
MLGKLSNDQAMLLYGNFAPYTTMPVVEGAQSTQLTTCGLLNKAIEANCLTQDVVYETLIVAADTPKGERFYSQPVLLQQTTLRGVSFSATRTKASSFYLEWNQSYGASTLVSVSASKAWHLPGGRGDDFDLALLFNRSHNSDPSLTIAVDGCYHAQGTLIDGDQTVCIEPFTEYRVNLTSISSHGRVSRSGAVVVTAGAVPTLSLTSLSLTDITANSVLVHGLLPARLHGLLTSAKLTAMSSDDTTVSTQSLSLSTPRASISLPLLGLSPFTAYTVQVQLATAQGYGPMSETKLFSTPQGVPSIPLDATLATAGGGNFTLTWLPPAQTNGILLAFEINITTLAGNSTAWLVDPASTAANVSLGSEDDVVRVRAQTHAGFGPYSAQAIFPLSSATNPLPIPSRHSKNLMPLTAAGIVILACLIAAFVVRRHKKKLMTSFRPTPDEYELVREQIELLEMIGSGAHGEVWLGVSQLPHLQTSLFQCIPFSV